MVPLLPIYLRKNIVNTRQRLLDKLEKEWRKFRDSYGGLSDPELIRPGVVGQWSIKDIIGHVTTWEEETLKHLPHILGGERPPRYSVLYGGIDAFNAKTTAGKRKLSLPETLRQQGEVHARLLNLINKIPEEQLGGETRIRRRLRLDTYSHYRKHAAAIWKWRTK